MLSKFRILAFSDDELRSKTGEYQVHINPETYAHDFRTQYARDRGINAAAALAQFKTHDPQNVRFDIVIDATGVVPGVTSVDDELAKLRKTAYSFNGKVHSPNYLKLLWGKLSFDCMLTSMAVSYQLFSPTGVPLRAKLDLAFRQHQTPADLARRSGKQSADLTHVQVTGDDLTLPLMCYRIYDNPALYPQVARANDLNDLMHLTPGVELLFPPVTP